MSKSIYTMSVYVAENNNTENLLNIAIKAQEYLKQKYPSIFNKVLKIKVVTPIHLLSNPIKPEDNKFILNSYLNIEIELSPIEQYKLEYLARYLVDECNASTYSLKWKLK